MLNTNESLRHWPIKCFLRFLYYLFKNNMLLGPKSIIVTLLHLIINDIPTILSLKLLQKLLKNCNTKKRTQKFVYWYFIWKLGWVGVLYFVTFGSLTSCLLTPEVLDNIIIIIQRAIIGKFWGPTPYHRCFSQPNAWNRKFKQYPILFIFLWV